MKFGRRLREERCQAWSEQYLDYSQLKKATKLDEETAADSFFSLLRDELRKVQEFMRVFLEDHDEDVCSIELLPAASSTKLVHDIEEFQRFTALNNMAVRKALKRFRKRHPSRMDVSNDSMQRLQCGVSEADIESWLTAPALQFLNLSTSSSCFGSRMMQIDFWGRELKVGLRRAMMQICGAQPVHPTQLRLGFVAHESAPEHLCMKNTFIDTCDAQPQGAAARPRAASAPPKACTSRHATTAGLEDATNDVKLEGSSSNTEHEQLPPSSLQAESQLSQQQQRRACPPEAADTSSRRWWVGTEAECPLSGFPIKLLPYPPFKLVHRGSTACRRTTHLVDGLFLVLQAIAEWRVDVFGRSLTSAEIVALDAHVKKCKLGPFRLGHAMRLAESDSVKDRAELNALTRRAIRRLGVLRHIQSTRH